MVILLLFMAYPIPLLPDFINGGNMIPPDGNLLSKRFPGVDFSDGSGNGLHFLQNHLSFDFVQFMDQPVQSLFHCGRHGKPPFLHSSFC